MRPRYITPEGAKKLVADAREQSRLALAELRDLVRGTAPSILIDRGLVAAVASIALTNSSQWTSCAIGGRNTCSTPLRGSTQSAVRTK